MFDFRAAGRAINTDSKLNRRSSRASAAPACEAIEPRTYFAVVFGTPTSVAGSSATAPLVAGKFHGTTGSVDLAAASASAVQIFDGGGNGTFAIGTTIPLPSSPAPGNSFLVGNFKGSGSDIVLLSQDSVSQNGVITYQTGDGTGKFTPGASSSIADNGIGFHPIFAATGDFNADGHADIAVVGQAPGISTLVLAVLLSNGDGTFTEVHDYSLSSSNSLSSTADETVLTADLGNGHTDILVNDFSGGSIDVFMGAGDGSFNSLGGLPFAATAITTGAFTSSGHLDIAGVNGNQLMLLFGNGMGAFTAAPSAFTLSAPVTAINAADYDGDGKTDIVTNQGLFLGNGDGTFQPATPLGAMLGGGGNFTDNLLTADANADGKPDVIGFDASSTAIISTLNTTPGATSLALVSDSPNPGLGSTVQFTATVSSGFAGSPTGQVTFLDGTTQIGSANVSGGVAVFSGGADLALGVHSITASYSGDANFDPSTSAPITETVLPASTTTLTSNDNPALPGAAVTFTAVVTGTGGVPTGNVEFFDGGSDLGPGTLDGTGTTSITTSTLSSGQHSITARYSGDTIFGSGVSAVLTEIVNQPTLVPLVTGTTIPKAVVGGAKVHGNATITLKNVTAATISGPVTVTLFASSDNNVANAVMITAIPHKKLKIKAGQTIKLKTNIKSLPAALTDGNYTLLAQSVDPAGNAASSNTGPGVAVAAPFVQLTASSVVSAKPAAIKAGRKGSVSVTLTNSGNVPTSGVANIAIGLSTDGQTPSISLAMLTNKVQIKAGHPRKLVVHFTVPANQPAGMFFPTISVTQNASTASAVGQTMIAIV